MRHTVKGPDYPCPAPLPKILNYLDSQGGVDQAREVQARGQARASVPAVRLCRDAGRRAQNARGNRSPQDSLPL